MNPPLISCRQLGKSFGSRPLFAGINLQIAEGDRVGLIGANGSGKSTLLKIIAGLEAFDEGDRAVRQGLRTAYVAQDLTLDRELTVVETIAQALDRAAMVAMRDERQRQAAIARALGQAGFATPTLPVSALSGGWQRRLAIAAALVIAPDLLLLDEPTNHLDIDGIRWLERLIATAAAAVVMVSHDRAFLQEAATRIWELDRRYPQGYLVAAGRYSDFLAQRQLYRAAQAAQQSALAGKVRREIEWLQHGPKARTTKSQARIQAAQGLIAELALVREREARGETRIEFQATERRTKRLLLAEDLELARGDRTLFKELSFLLRPRLRLGLIGPNGSGKSSLLRVLSGSLAPDRGKITAASEVKIVTFDQHREQLDPDISLRRALVADGDSVIYRGRPIHVVGWGQRFLFRPEQLEMRVGMLSGGEQARVLIARLMLEPADILLLDEPTNDLDIPTIEILEESLTEFPGAVVLVTHDRFLLDSVTDLVIGLDGEGGAGLFADCNQWQERQEERRREKRRLEQAPRSPAPGPKPPRRALKYLEAREYEQMEATIEQAEQEVVALQARLDDPEIAADAPALAAAYEGLAQARSRVDHLYQRWSELEEKMNRPEQQS